MVKYGIGASVLRKEDDRFLRGRGQYVGDFRATGLQEVAFVRSPVAHARLKQVCIPEQFRGVVFTADDLVNVKPIASAPSLTGFKRSAEPILATDKVRFVGEMVAICVAPTRADAEDIADAVGLDLEELPAVTDMLAACKPDSPLVHDDWNDNIFVEFNENFWKDDLSGATIKVSKSIRTARHCMFPMEGRGVLAYRDERLRNLTLVTSTQFPHCVQTGLSECLGLSHGDIRIISPDVGGGFGYKGLLCREEVALAWLALRLGHPVRWLEDCREHLVANANCREHHYEITGYAAADGKLLGIECVAHVDAGAYSSYPVSASVEAAQIANLLPGPYMFSAYRCRAAAVATNKCPILPYRGVARSGVCLAIEAIMDAIAQETGLEPHDVRLRNMVPPEQISTYRNVVGKQFDSGDHQECLWRAVDAIGVQKIRERQKRPEPDGRHIGVGISFFVEQGAHGTNVLASWGRPIVPGYEQAQVKLTVDGEVEIHIGTHSHGQGHETTYAQVAHEILGVEIDKIKIVQGDTMYTPYSTATWGSRSMVHGGGAVARASQLLAKRAAQIGAWLLQTEVENVRVADGKVIAGDSSVTLREVAHVWYLQPQNLPAGVDTGGLDVTAGYRAGRDSGTFTYAAHAAVVAVDAATGVVEILDYVVVEDGGTLVNPMIVDGQICGGTAQGIGTCLYEAMPFDAQGQPLASTMLDYMLPGATEVPDIRIEHMQTPSPYTEFGIKGLGEGGAVGPPAAIVSAVNDALRPLNAAVFDLPLTPERILAAIEAAAHQQGAAA